MKTYRLNDFRDNDAWLIFRLDAFVQNKPLDIYHVLSLPAGDLIAYELVETYLSQTQADSLLTIAKTKIGHLPHRIILQTTDPAKTCLSKSAEKLGLSFELIASAYLEELIAPVKQIFNKYAFSTSSVDYIDSDSEINSSDEPDELDQKSAEQMVPDSYDPCPCASGNKYKFCCKKVFYEIMEAMVAVEEGKIAEALKWIDKAKTVVGETAEILCRESIVYSYCDSKKSEELLDRCLRVNPNHPRAHYIRGLTLKHQGNFLGSIKAYEMAIANYPPTDHFHLNEVYNNLGVALYEIGNLEEAKIAWEKALLFLPSDKIVRQNLAEFIYNKPT